MAMNRVGGPLANLLLQTFFPLLPAHSRQMTQNDCCDQARTLAWRETHTE